MTIEEIEKLMALMERFQIESIDLPGELQLRKTVHLAPRQPDRPRTFEPPPAPVRPDLDFAFASSSAPPIPLSALDRFSPPRGET